MGHFYEKSKLSIAIYTYLYLTYKNYVIQTPSMGDLTGFEKHAIPAIEKETIMHG